jgi:hypothetical protein
MKKPRTMTLTLKVEDDRPDEINDPGDMDIKFSFDPPLSRDELSYLAPWATQFMRALTGADDAE